MISNYHTHTLFCDGKNTPEEIVVRAVELGCPELGFSEHSYIGKDGLCGMSSQAEKEYIACILSLKEKYREKIRILLGLELDMLSPTPDYDYDYIIGSVHYIEKDDKYLSVDYSKEVQQADVEKYYGGDFYSYAEDYYDLVSQVYDRTKCDIIGHFDLVTKFNESGVLFDTSDKRYVAAVEKAIYALKDKPVMFEFNTGAISRGYRQTPYPEPFIIDMIKQTGKKIIFSSDCHDSEYLLFGKELFESTFGSGSSTVPFFG